MERESEEREDVLSVVPQRRQRSCLSVCCLSVCWLSVCWLSVLEVGDRMSVGGRGWDKEDEVGHGCCDEEEGEGRDEAVSDDSIGTSVGYADLCVCGVEERSCGSPEFGCKARVGGC